MVHRAKLHVLICVQVVDSAKFSHFWRVYDIIWNVEKPVFLFFFMRELSFFFCVCIAIENKFTI